ncbi:hypothetical protein OCU04_005544 [Sclerotinia nivalis]|uniref:HTH CENPB-type domain-containing protein n=1 Tax=Sclerotinia nivalis TaxID=352851 RepID=A0A9X0DKM5_9HELO|nr:hypothetical protein OCU04_005544 [Sclerotinia nivalis]
MVRQKSQTATELDTQINKAILEVKFGLYKSTYKATKRLQLSKRTVTRRINGGLSRTQARQQQQKLSSAQENVLLKWIKELTINGYSPGHRLLKEIVGEVRSKQIYNLDNPSFDLFEFPLQYKLGRDWVLRFIIRYPHLKVIIKRRIEFV